MATGPIQTRDRRDSPPSRPDYRTRNFSLHQPPVTPAPVTVDSRYVTKTNAERQADYRRRKAEEREARQRAAGRASAEREAQLAKFTHPCPAHRQSAEFIARCPACGHEPYH